MREIFEVIAKVVDSNGTYNNLTNYPKSFDTKNYNDNILVTTNRAYSAYYEALGDMCKVDNRKVQYACIIRCSDGMQIERKSIGVLDDGNENH